MAVWNIFSFPKQFSVNNFTYFNPSILQLIPQSIIIDLFPTSARAFIAIALSMDIKEEHSLKRDKRGGIARSFSQRIHSQRRIRERGKKYRGIEAGKDQSQGEDKSVMAYNLIPRECDSPYAIQLLPFQFYLFPD